MEVDVSKIKKDASKKLISDILDKKKQEGIEKVFTEIDHIYIEKIRDIHFEVYSISLKEIAQEIPKLFGIDPDNKIEIETKLKDYKVIEQSKLLVNACCSRDCPYFLKFTESLDLHINKATMPAFHKTIVMNLDKSAEEIFAKIVNFDCVMKDGSIIFKNYKVIIEDMNNRKEKYLSYIDKVKKKYQLM